VPPGIALEVQGAEGDDAGSYQRALRHGEFYEYNVQMEWFRGTLFFMRGWETMVQRLGMEKDDIIIFELDVNCLHNTLIRAHSSTQSHMECKRHGMTVAK
jgi:hypothetical protein